MASASVLNNDGNLRPKNKSQLTSGKCPIKVHSPKVRLRLEDAVNNAEKMKISSVQLNFMPPELINKLNNEKQDKQDYFSDNTPNRNKICQMKNIMFGKGDYEESRPIMRCRGEDSQNNLNRSRGILQIVGDSKNGYVIPQETCHVRCPSRDAYDNLQKGRGAQMTSTIQQSERGPPEHSVQRRRPPEDVLQKQDSMSSLMGKVNINAQNATDQRAPRCPKETWENNRGGAMSNILTTSNVSANSNMAPPKKRVLNEDGSPINPQNSQGVGQILGSVSGSSNDQVRAPRVRLGGMEIAEKNKGSISTVFNQNKSIDNSEINQAPAPRVRPEAEEIAQSSKGVATRCLFERYGNLPRDPRPKSHITPQSLKTAQTARGGAMKDSLCPRKMPHSKKRRPRSSY